ncbi:heme ABC exporter ATP-binding protein CcmA [Azospirillum sp. SYSU D00513]|uniref:heme ABC exporter ATP-binding protein CcmA n=1 Tax=Azospirillum sp. SYSU D00513 TaxID=2812561 RepID=UPI001A95661D|nr:heme ABC exporter ATP-binding protein CcmA [Azospirillum sp. SYSU D00513]
MPVFTGSELTCLRGDRLVFTGLDFRVAPGEALLLLGPNGSGKSSLLRMMAGLLKPFRGRLAWDGAPVPDDPDGHRAKIHYVGHLDAVKPVLTAAENLAFWAGLGGAADPRASALAALDRLGVPQIAGVPGRYLSAGQKRRLNLARVLAAPAPLWLLDEPSVALDRAAVALLEGIIAEHRAAGGMVAVSTHADIAMPGARELHLDDFTPVTGGNAFDDDAFGDGGIEGEDAA